MAKMRTRIWITTSVVTKKTSWEVPAMEIQILVREPISWLQMPANINLLMGNIYKETQINKIARSWTNPLPWIKPLRAF